MLERKIFARRSLATQLLRVARSNRCAATTRTGLIRSRSEYLALDEISCSYRSTSPTSCACHLASAGRVVNVSAGGLRMPGTPNRSAGGHVELYCPVDVRDLREQMRGRIREVPVWVQLNRSRTRRKQRARIIAQHHNCDELLIAIPVTVPAVSSLGIKRLTETATTEAVRGIIDGGQEAKTEIRN